MAVAMAMVTATVGDGNGNGNNDGDRDGDGYGNSNNDSGGDGSGGGGWRWAVAVAEGSKEVHLLSTPTNLMSPEPSTRCGTSNLLIRLGRSVWALLYHGAGTSEPPPANHGVSPSLLWMISFAVIPPFQQTDMILVLSTYLHSCGYDRYQFAHNP
jgi:hypothetical protein